MAITQAMCTSFKVALLNGEMDVSSDTSQSFKIALLHFQYGGNFQKLISSPHL